MSFQNRLASYQDKRNSRLIKNSATLAGIYADVIMVDAIKNSLHDITKTIITDLEFVPVIFPYKSLDESEIRQDKNSEGKIITHLTAASDEAFTIYIASNKFINKDDYLFWIIEDFSYAGNTAITSDPVILLLKVKGIKAKFGAYGITHKQMDCTLESPATLPNHVLDLLTEAHEKRNSTFLNDHERIQQEP